MRLPIDAESYIDQLKANANTVGWIGFLFFCSQGNFNDIRGANHRNAAREELEVTEGPSLTSRLNVLQLLQSTEVVKESF